MGILFHSYVFVCFYGYQLTSPQGLHYSLPRVAEHLNNFSKHADGGHSMSMGLIHQEDVVRLIKIVVVRLDGPINRKVAHH